ncbi:MAG: DUF3870 domain-containing protein [Eubacteriales bacterium]|nr:DUF3870 domain-containing protein [Eubacteriales bacterium]
MQSENKLFPPGAIYVVGNARTNVDNAITSMYGSFFIGFIVDQSGLILDLDATAGLKLTVEVIRSLLIGKTLLSDPEEIESLVRNRYLGSSQRAIVAAFKDAAQKFIHKTNTKAF